VPEGAVVKGAVAIAASGLMDYSSDSGKQVFGKFVDVPIGQVGNVEFDYVTPWYGSTLLQKQSGQVSLDVNFMYIEDGSIQKAQDIQLINRTRIDLKK
jgi:hypothetical protein